MYGFLDDHAFVIQACIDLYETNFDDELLLFAYELQKQQDTHFWDAKKKRYLSTDGTDSSIILRLSEGRAHRLRELCLKNRSYSDHDGAEPSPNAVAALNLLRLGHYFNDSSLLDRLRSLFGSYTRQLTKLPMTMPTMMRCLDLYKHGMNEIIIQSTDEEEIHRITQYLQTSYLPNTIVIRIRHSTHSLARYNQALKSFADGNNEQTTKIFLCRNFQCELPVRSLDELKEKLEPLVLASQ